MNHKLEETTKQQPGHGLKPTGFTLIEIMITVAIVAIISAIALPSYTKQVRKSRRVDAKSAVLDMAARLERYNTVNFVYSVSEKDLGYATPMPISVPSITAPYYRVHAVLTTSPPGYLLTATPVGDQVNDSCGAFTLSDLGVQALVIDGAAGSAAQVAECWK